MNVYIPGGLATRGPCGIGYHIPSKDEWVRIRAVMITLSINNASGYGNNLKLPRGDGRDANLDAQYNGYYWTADKGTSPVSWSDSMQILANTAGIGTMYRGAGLAIRPFKDSYIVPDSTWEVLQGALGSIGIFYNSNRGLISISEDGTTGITIVDKNLGATVVYNYGDTLSQKNCGNIYQWGNNYGFPYSGATTTSSTEVDASSYGPGNYYSSSTFITGSSDWSSVQNDNLRGGEDGNVNYMSELKNAYIGEVSPLVLQQVFDFTTSDLHGYTNTKDPNNSYGLTINTSGHYCTGGGTGGSGQIWKQISAKRYWGRIKFMVVNQIYGGVIVGGWGYTGTPTQQLCGANPYGTTIHIDSNGVNLNTLSASYSLNTYYYLDGKFDNGNYTCTLYDVNMNKLKEITATNSDTVWRAAGFGGWGGRNGQSCFRIYGYREAYDNN